MPSTQTLTQLTRRVASSGNMNTGVIIPSSSFKTANSGPSSAARAGRRRPRVQAESDLDEEEDSGNELPPLKRPAPAVQRRPVGRPRAFDGIMDIPTAPVDEESEPEYDMDQENILFNSSPPAPPSTRQDRPPLARRTVPANPPISNSEAREIAESFEYRIPPAPIGRRNREDRSILSVPNNNNQHEVIGRIMRYLRHQVNFYTAFPDKAYAKAHLYETWDRRAIQVNEFNPPRICDTKAVAYVS